MNPRSETDVIVEHALDNEDNLSISLKIISAQQEICANVVSQFMQVLQTTVGSRLADGWEVAVNTDAGNYESPFTEFVVAKSRLNSRYEITLVGDGVRFPKKLYFAVRSDDSEKAITHVKEIVEKEYAKGRSSVSFWYRYVDPRSKFADWGSEETTLLLFRQAEAANYFTDHLVKLAQVVEQALKTQPGDC